jgi:hypothetical protein
MPMNPLSFAWKDKHCDAKDNTSICYQTSCGVRVVVKEGQPRKSNDQKLLPVPKRGPNWIGAERTFASSISSEVCCVPRPQSRRQFRPRLQHGSRVVRERERERWYEREKLFGVGNSRGCTANFCKVASRATAQFMKKKQEKTVL